MAHPVTISVKSKAKLRREQVPTRRTEIICSDFRDGDGQRYFFKDSDGSEMETLEINDVLTLDIDKPVDMWNWRIAKKFKALNPEDAEALEFIDQEEENDKSINFSDQVFKVESFIRENKEDSRLLAKIYRRLIGLIDGISDKAVFRSLLDLAREKPDKFLVGGEIISKREEFENMALIDIAIERGIMTRDESMIKLNGKIYAQNQEKAAFLLNEDKETYFFLLRAMEGKTSRPQQTPYEAIIEGSDAIDYNENALNRPMGDSNAAKEEVITEKQIADSITEFAKNGTIGRTGTNGVNTRYTLPEVAGKEFTKKELTEYFKKNLVQYKMYRSLSALA